MKAEQAGDKILPTEESLRAIPVLERVALAAKKAVEESTGEGTESSGQGRYEWGTWCDTALFAQLKEHINDVKLEGSSGLWETLWPLVGGEQGAASVVVAGGQDWEMKLHVFMSNGARAEDEEPPFTDSFPTGSLVFLKPLLGITNLRKLRKIGSRMVPLGDVMPLNGAAADGSAFGGSQVGEYQLLLGGALHEMSGTSGPSVVLEIGLLPPMGLPSRHDPSLPYFPAPGSPPHSLLAAAFVSAAGAAEARQAAEV